MVRCQVNTVSAQHIEKLADAKELTAAERTELRRTRSRPVLETLQRWLVATVAKEPPKSELAQAAAYVINHWTALNRFVDDGGLSLDNNLVERQLRDIALGRRYGERTIMWTLA